MSNEKRRFRLNVHVYTDASYCHKTQTAVGGCLLLASTEPDDDLWRVNHDTWGEVITHMFTETSNIRAEFRAFFSAVNTAIHILGLSEQSPCDVRTEDVSLTVFTDCQTIAGLHERRHRLESRQFCSRKTGLPLANKDMYQTFFDIVNRWAPEIIWVRGHLPAKLRNDVHHNFHRVDKATRRKLRANQKKGPGE